jgi:hypothetical protein
MPVTVAGPLTPYITPQILTNAPTGISWATIPSMKATAAQQEAEQMNICLRATSMVEATANNVLRATIDTETLYGPDFRVTINRNTGVTRCELSRSPVTQVLGGQFSNAASFPPQWVPLAADQFAIDRPIIGLYGSSAPSNAGDGGQSVYIAPGNISWANGRHGYQIQVQYVNGWPHCSLTASAAAGATTVQVDDCTAWGPPSGTSTGAAGIIYDGNDQEAVSCLAASATSGAGILTLAAPLSFGHGAGVVLSSFPAQVMQATILFATAEALVRGATATVAGTISGTGVATSSSHYELMQVAKELIWPYRRVI